METYQLKNKLSVTDAFLDSLTNRGWQEIESLQNQIANIEETPENYEVIKLLKGLVTSYYVFVGGLENLNIAPVKAQPVVNEPIVNNIDELDTEVTKHVDLIDDDIILTKPVETSVDIKSKQSSEFFEPFEYFVDFDEPTGEPISDDDLYGNL